MSMMTAIKVRKAAALVSKGNTEEAMKLYQEALDEGCQDAKALLTYSVLLFKAERFQEARELLVKIQKYPMTDDTRRQMFVNYANTVFKLGDTQKAIDVLEHQHEKQESGLIYETLGYLYVEAGETEKALEYNTKAYEYDDEDAITLDNLGQTYYRLVGDRKTAKEYFEKALAVRPGQIDTLYFLAQYDLEAGDKQSAREKLEKALEGRFSPLNYATKEKIQAILDTL